MFGKLKQVGGNDDGLISTARLISVYMVAGGGYTMAGGGGIPSTSSTVAKCLPILCLVFCTGHKALTGSIYACYITLGLLLSAVGDALLAWDQLGAGMTLFAIALLVYIIALPTNPLLPVRAIVLAVFAVVVVSQLQPPASVSSLVPLYALCLWGAVWRGGAVRAHSSPTRGIVGGAVGRGAMALGLELFAISDTCLAFHMFYKPLPYHQLIVMGTYYIAQLFIALSTYENDFPPTPKHVKAQ